MTPSRLARVRSFRSGPAYRRLPRVLPTRPTTPPPGADLHVVTISGRDHVDLCAQMLLSLSDTWSELPTVHVLPDRTSSCADLAGLRKAYCGPLRFIEWETIRAHHTNRGRAELVEFGEIDPFGRKLAVALASADLRRSLWVDNDILFFRDPVPLIRAVPGDKPFLGAMRDAHFGRTALHFGYAPGLAREFLRETDPAVNAGLHLSEGSVYEALDLAPRVRFALASGEHHYLTEQTIVAIAALRSLGIYLDESVAHMDDDDIYPLRETYRGRPWHARHYTGNVRHLFWRDAVFLAWDRLNADRAG